MDREAVPVIAVVAFLALATAAALRRTAPWRDRSSIVRSRPWQVLLLAFLALALTVPEALPVHDHNAYLERADCAHALSRSSAETPWGTATFVVYGLALNLVPYRVATLGYVSLAFTLLSLVLMGAFVRRLFASAGCPEEGRRVAWLAAALCVIHPAFLRLSVAATFYPYTMCMLWAAGWFALEVRARGRLVDTLAALLFLALASLGNHVQLVWLPLAALAPLCWPRRGRPLQPAAAALAWLLFAAFVLPPVLSTYQTVFGEGGGVGRTLGPSLLTILYLDPRVTAAPSILLFVVGLVAVAVGGPRRRRALVPVLYAFLATEVFFGAQVDLLHGYPTRFIHGFVSLWFSAIVAAVGAEQLLRRVSERRRPVALAVTLGLALALAPLAGHGFRFLTEDRMLNRELRAIENAAETLPPHALLVIPSPIQAPLGCADRGNDPVQVAFPRAAYGARLAARFGRPPRVATVPEFLAEGEGASALDETLLYVGSAQRSFLPCEVREGLVPPDFRRPELADLRERYEFEPVATFSLDTDDNPAVAARLGGGLVASLELGFYRLREKGSDPPT